MGHFLCYSWSAVLLLTLAGRPMGAIDCNLVGEGEQESKMEKAVLATLAPLKNRVFSQRIIQGDNDYTYRFAVCGNAGNTSGAGLVQIDNKNGNKEVVVGRIDDTHIINGTDWIMLVYKKGEKYNEHCNKEERTARVMISCNRKTIGANFMMVNEERGKVEDCFYLFEMDSSVACPPEDMQLSVGSIMLIVFASLVALYLIVGFLYQRLVIGAKGMEQIPNYSFWQDLGNLMAKSSAKCSERVGQSERGSEEYLKPKKDSQGSSAFIISEDKPKQSKPQFKEKNVAGLEVKHATDIEDTASEQGVGFDHAGHDSSPESYEVSSGNSNE